MQKADQLDSYGGGSAAWRRSNAALGSTDPERCMRSGVCYGLVRRTIKPLGNYGEPGPTLSSVHFGVLS